jgi:aspartyl/asparaginyl beta-hydroxylase (cupin superfamily)
MSFNFKMYGNVNVSYLKNTLTELDWSEHTLRQSLFKRHQHTQTLEIMWDIDSLHTNKIGKIHSNYYKLNIESFLEEIKPIYESNCGDGYFVRVLLVKLKPNSNIVPHTDKGDSLINCNRTHIAIITNPKVTFTIDGETKHLKEGEIWEIDNTKEHSVDNNSNEDRVHLIMDWFVESYNLKEIKTNKLI